MSATRYRVTAEYVSIKVTGPPPLGRGLAYYIGVYRDGYVPENADPESVGHHLATGQIEPFEED
jgi:hypothetical protein